MKLLLAQPKKFILGSGSSSLTKTDLTAQIKPLDDSEESQICFNLFCEEILEETDCTLERYMKYLQTRHKSNLKLSMRWWKSSKSLHTRLEGSVLQGLSMAFGENIQVQFALKKAKAYDTTKPIKELNARPDSKVVVSKEMAIRTSASGEQESFCEDYNLGIPKPWKLFVGDLDKQTETDEFLLSLSATIEIWIDLKKFASPLLPPTGIPLTTGGVMRKMLDEKIESDMTIVAMNQVEIKCHKSFLSVQSPVFAAMFRSDCKERSTSKIEMVEMSEEVVKSFLAYLYYGDLTQASDSSVIAFELLEIGHKYEIPALEENVKKILLQKSKDWFDVEIALRIFSVYGKVEGFENLKTKSVQVMKAKRKELEKSEDYKKLFESDPKSAMELFEAFSQ